MWLFFGGKPSNCLEPSKRPMDIPRLQLYFQFPGFFLLFGKQWSKILMFNRKCISNWPLFHHFLITGVWFWAVLKKHHEFHSESPSVSAHSGWALSNLSHMNFKQFFQNQPLVNRYEFLDVILGALRDSWSRLRSCRLLWVQRGRPAPRFRGWKLATMISGKS